LKVDTALTEDKRDCLRCGECCVKASPTLHPEDLHLIENGRIGKKDLITLRRGELVTDNVHNLVEPSTEEVIKIREKTGTNQGCCFYDSSFKACTIYDARPLQCKALKCWDNREILEILGRPKLRRSDVVLNGVLLGLIEEHEKRCGFEVLDSHVRRIVSEGDKAVEDLLELLKFDFHLRPFVSKKLSIPLEETDFFFGRPLVDTIKNYGLQVVREPDGGFFLTTVSENGKSETLK
jgi:Fe-S-cluster containining protein